MQLLFYPHTRYIYYTCHCILRACTCRLQQTRLVVINSCYIPLLVCIAVCVYMSLYSTCKQKRSISGSKVHVYTCIRCQRRSILRRLSRHYDGSKLCYPRQFSAQLVFRNAYACAKYHAAIYISIGGKSESTQPAHDLFNITLQARGQHDHALPTSTYMVYIIIHIS